MKFKIFGWRCKNSRQCDVFMAVNLVIYQFSCRCLSCLVTILTTTSYSLMFLHVVFSLGTILCALTCAPCDSWKTGSQYIMFFFQALRVAGVNVFPAEDSSKYVSIQDKVRVQQSDYHLSVSSQPTKYYFKLTTYTSTGICRFKGLELFPYCSLLVGNRNKLERDVNIQNCFFHNQAEII